MEDRIFVEDLRIRIVRGVRERERRAVTIRKAQVYPDCVSGVSIARSRSFSL
ncbi:MAG TPA: hypothetical protein VG102_01085 [Candidatus Paceibacterota bacterium]|jgi:hypothetical protein|nr:hypothetical protein [Candidatus Paceibacterota bacterium]